MQNDHNSNGKLENSANYNVISNINSIDKVPESGNIIICDGSITAKSVNQSRKRAKGNYYAFGIDSNITTESITDDLFIPFLGRNNIYLWSHNDSDFQSQKRMSTVANILISMGLSPKWINWNPYNGHSDIASLTEDDSIPIESLLKKAQLWKSSPVRTECNHVEHEMIIPSCESNIVKFKTIRIEKEKSGNYAHIEVYLNDNFLSFMSVNITKVSDRNSYVNEIYKFLPENIRNLITHDDLKKEFVIYCSKLKSIYNSNLEIKEISGLEVLTPISYIVKPYIVEGGGSILFGNPKAGKSYMAIALAVSIDAGISKLFDVKQAGNVLFVNIERNEIEFQKRLTEVNHALGLPKTRPLKYINAKGYGLDDLEEVLAFGIGKYGIKLTIIDSISRTGKGDLREDQVANAITDIFNRYCNTWLAIGHVSKEKKDSVFGSIHFEAGADILIKTVHENDENKLGVGIQITKANDTPTTMQERFALEFNEDGILSEIRKAKPFEFPSVENEANKGDKQLDKETIVDYLSEVGKATATEIAENAFGTLSKRLNISKILNRDNDFVKLDKEGKHQYYALREKSHNV